MEKKFDIFISYRRNGGGFEAANLLYDRLTRAGYHIFMDIENLRSGKFNEQLYDRIDNSKDVLVILPPGSLDRCKDEDDWLRLEIAHAIKAGKNIIPIFLRNFEYPEEPLPDDIAELTNYQGVEASPELFNAFLERLKRLLVSKRHITWDRVKRQVLFSLLPLFLVTATLLYLHYRNERKEQIQLEQTCKEAVSFIASGFVHGNIQISAINEIQQAWKDFFSNNKQAKNSTQKAEYRRQLIQLIDFKLEQINDTTKRMDWQLSAGQEHVLARNGISTEDIKASTLMVRTNLEETQDFLLKSREWLSMPENGWPNDLDKAIDILAELNKEMIRADIYSFNILINEMPVIVKETYHKFLPMLSNYPDMDFRATRNELEAKENRSMERCNELITKHSSIVGEENKLVSAMENQLEMMTEALLQAQIEAKKNHQYDSMRRVIVEKKEIMQQKRAELDSKKQEIRAAYQRMLQKTMFDENEDPGMQWGKIIHLAQFGYTQIIIENNCKAEYERLKEEARKSGKDPNTIDPITSTISSKEVFQEVEKRLDAYLSYNKSADPDAAIYIPAIKQYYKLIAERQLKPVGVLIVGTKDNMPHPLLKTGDIVVEKKGEPLDRVDTYFELNKKEGENTQKLIRFVNGKETEITGIIPADCKVLIGVQNLWEER